MRDRARPCVSHYENQDTTWFTSYRGARYDFETMNRASQIRFTDFERRWLSTHTPRHDEVEDRANETSTSFTMSPSSTACIHEIRGFLAHKGWH